MARRSFFPQTRHRIIPTRCGALPHSRGALSHTVLRFLPRRGVLSHTTRHSPTRRGTLPHGVAFSHTAWRSPTRRGAFTHKRHGAHFTRRRRAGRSNSERQVRRARNWRIVGEKWLIRLTQGSSDLSGGPAVPNQQTTGCACGINLVSIWCQCGVNMVSIWCQSGFALGLLPSWCLMPCFL